MKMTKTIIGLLFTLAIASPADAMSTFTDHWLSGTTLFASASTDSDFVDEVASADVQISGPSGSSSFSSFCEWYYASVQTSLVLTSEGTHTASSNHWSQSVANILLQADAFVMEDVKTNFKKKQSPTQPQGNPPMCGYDQDCPGGTRLCSHINTTQWADPNPPPADACFDYLHLKHEIAVRLPFTGTWSCIGETKSVSTGQGECTPAP